MFKTIQQIHFVGIGGSGMSGIAEVLLNLGYKVSGSDLKQSEVTERLKRLGAAICYGHREKNVGNAQVVVTSTAVDQNNPEVIYSRKNKIPVIPRIEMLAEIARLKYTVAVAGTHGKTTTTSMAATLLQEGGLDPTFIVGGKINHLQSGAKLGRGEFLVAEADESDGSFLKLSPTIAIITNIDNDHLDYYRTVKNLHKAFVEFANRVPFYGCAIICMDDPGVRAVLPNFRRRIVTYGIDSETDFSARDISAKESGAQFTLVYHKKPLGSVRLKVSGRHNILNSLAAIACGMELKIPFGTIVAVLGKYENVARRLEVKGEKNGAYWVDDYGHHPTEIKATLSALRDKYPNKKLVVLFQPHRYSRTKILAKEFGKCFSSANEVFLLPIYPAGEKPIAGVSSKNIISSLKKNKVHATLLNGNQVSVLNDHIKPDRVFLTLGAGDVWKIGQKLFALVPSSYSFFGKEGPCA